MTTQFLILSLLISCHVLTATLAEETGFVGSLDRKALGLDKKDKVSHFRFYFHERFTGSNATSVTVVPPLPQYTPPPTSGWWSERSRGCTRAYHNRSSIYAIVVNFALTEGKYNGSTITVVGRNRLSLKIREMPVIGGSGVFKFATGYVETSTLYVDADRSTIEYNIYVSHY
uniref:Dirigent protein n=1 Tax=Glycine max TaxID=3847 RepID=A0A0R0KLM2_SOYBN